MYPLSSHSQYISCRIRHSHPIIIAGTRHPLDSILPGIAPEDFTLTSSAADVSYLVGAAKKDTVDKFEHDTLSISYFDGFIIHSKLLFGYHKGKFF